MIELDLDKVYFESMTPEQIKDLERRVTEELSKRNPHLKIVGYDFHNLRVHLSGKLVILEEKDTLPSEVK